MWEGTHMEFGKRHGVVRLVLLIVHARRSPNAQNDERKKQALCDINRLLGVHEKSCTQSVKEQQAKGHTNSAHV
jgi:hypothetical protein